MRGSIEVEINQGSFSNGETAYLVVVDSDGTASTGYPITIGSSYGTPNSIRGAGDLTKTSTLQGSGDLTKTSTIRGG